MTINLKMMMTADSLHILLTSEQNLSPQPNSREQSTLGEEVDSVQLNGEILRPFERESSAKETKTDSEFPVNDSGRNDKAARLSTVSTKTLLS